MPAAQAVPRQCQVNGNPCRLLEAARQTFERRLKRQVRFQWSTKRGDRAAQIDQRLPDLLAHGRRSSGWRASGSLGISRSTAWSCTAATVKR